MDLYTVAATSIVQLIIAYAFKQFMEKRDKKIEALEIEVVKMRDDKIVQIQKDIEHGKNSRGRIHDAVETLNAKGERHDQQIIHLQEKTESYTEAVMKLERVATQLDTNIDRVEELSAIQYEQSKQVSALAERIKDLTK